MSDLSGSEVVAEAPEATEAATAVVATPEAPSSEAEQVVEAPPAPTTYTVKVGDEDRAVTLEDLQKGYMLQADYTRKTQAVAAQQKQLARAEALQIALDRDPVGTLKALADAYKVQTESSDDEYATPEEQRIRQLETWKAQQEQAATQAQIDRDLASLHRQYGEFDEDQVFVYALSNNLDLVSAYKAMTYDDLRTQAQEAKAAQAAKVEAETLEAKRVQAASVHQAETAQAGTVGSVQTKANSIREALTSALKEHGLSSMPRA